MKWWLIGGAAAAVLLLSRKASAACRPCYDAKSIAYQACRQIPVENRATRNTCFSAADVVFNNCLRACGG